jgi:hypothetical protein
MRDSDDTILIALRPRSTHLPPIQRMVEGPDLRSRVRPIPIGLRLAQGQQLVQPPVAPITQPRPKSNAERRNIYCSRPEMDGQDLAQCTYRDGFRRIHRHAPPKIVPTLAVGATW